MDQALQDTAKRLGTPEFQFFCITLAIQRETGGNLAETLANLGGVLRQRAQMKLQDQGDVVRSPRPRPISSAFCRFSSSA